MYTRAERERKQRDELARGFAADVEAGRKTTAELVARIAGVRQPEQAGAHDRRTLAQMVRDSGFSSAGPDELRPVLSIDGKVYR